MIALIRTISELKMDDELRSLLDADNKVAFYAKLEDIRGEIVRKIREGIAAADREALYAPGYLALLANDNVMTVIDLDFVERDCIDTAALRTYRRAARNAAENTERISLRSISASASEDWSLSCFHELNDLIGEDIDAIRNEPGYVGYANNFLNPDINTLRIPVSSRFLLVSHNEKIDISSSFSRIKMKETEIEDNLADAAEDLRITFKKAMFRELGKKTAIKFFPGSYLQSLKTDKLIAITRLIDLFGYSEDMDRAEAESLIASAFISAVNDIHDPISEHISLPVFRETDIRPENPGIYMDMLRKEAEEMEKREKSIESDEYQYITKEV